MQWIQGMRSAVPSALHSLRSVSTRGHWVQSMRNVGRQASHSSPCTRFNFAKQPARHLSKGSSKSRERPQGPITWNSVGLLIVAGSGCLYYYSVKEQERYERMTATKLEKGLGKPTIGGPFRLVDHDGQLRTDADFKGKWMLIYFGFTYCPDICPNELMRMTEIINRLEANEATRDKVVPLLITIDPERDGPNQLKDYLSDWHPRMLGLTGTPGDIREVCKNYRVYFSKAVLGNDPTNYLIDHSIMFYLMDDDGEFCDYFGKALTPAEIHDKITKYVTNTADENTHSDSSIAAKDIPGLKKDSVRKAQA